MKRLFFFGLVALGLTLATQTASAQYKHAIGGRIGDASGVTFKFFGKQNRAWDLILDFHSTSSHSDFRFTGLYEIHNPINNADGLRWYYGFGATVGSRNYKTVGDDELILKGNGVIGLDYKFMDAPINLSLDWKPSLELSPNSGFDAGGFGLSVRFTF